MDDNSRYVSIMMTVKQRKAVKELYSQNKWSYVEMETKIKGKPYDRPIEGKTTSRKPKAAKSQKGKPTKAVCAGNGGQHGGEPNPPGAGEGVGIEECPWCLLTPCIATRNHSWLGGGQPPCDENSGIRHQLYTHFWKVVSNVGGWNDPRYIERKLRTAYGGEWALVHRREVMPRCILEKVRELYPNPKGVSYMDHRWE